MKYKLPIFLVFILSFNSVFFAQGGWNIGYLKIRDVTESDIGKKFRPDFKSKKLNEDDVSIRDYFGTKDSNFLTIDNNKIKFVEQRKISVDAGYYENQFLYCKKCKALLRILDTTLLEIKKETFLFAADFEMDINDQSDKINFKKEIEISKKELDGLIFLNSKF
jgi:hypothetical protein